MWVPITEEDVLTVLSGPELIGYRSAAKANGQIDPMQPTIDQVTREVRGYVRNCKRFKVGEGNTIPESLMTAALDIVAFRMPKRVRRDPTPARETAYRDAVALLKEVAKGNFEIEEPLIESSDGSSEPSPSICAREKKYGRESQDGI